MRLLRVLLVALFGVFAVVAGLITAAMVSVAAALIVFVRRTLRGAGHARMTAEPRPRFSRSKAGDVIDVTATEVPVDSGRR